MQIEIPKFDKKHANGELRKRGDQEWFWVRIPVSMDSLSRQRLMQSGSGREAYCVYVHLVCLAAKDEPRGTLADERGPFTLEDIALRTSIPSDVLKKAISTLEAENIQWVCQSQPNGNDNSDPIDIYNSNSNSNSNSSEKSAKDVHFESFWESWPSHHRKADKKKCRQKWVLDGCDDRHGHIMASLDAWKSSKQWQKDKGEFIPAPHKWLNQQQYDAPVETIAKSNVASGKERDKLTPAQVTILLEEVRSAQPDVHHSAGNIETERAIRKAARQRGWMK